MKKSFIIAVCLMMGGGLFSSVTAQEVATDVASVRAEHVHNKRTPEQEAAKRTEMMKRDLLLNEAQTEAVYQINLRFALLRREATSREQIMQYLLKMNKELKQILTEDQYQQILEHQIDNGPQKQCARYPLRSTQLQTSQSLHD